MPLPFNQFLRPILAVASLTVKAAFRFRLVFLLTLFLLGAVVGLPLIIKDDGTARGFTQILLTYTLGTITMVLGFANLWLACGLLAREVEECQIQMVVVKPIARWQIWLGKWVGLLCLNALWLAIAGGAVFGLMQWRVQKLPAAQQAALRDQILVARGSARETVPDWESVTERIFQEQLKQSRVALPDRPLLRRQIAERVKAESQLVPPGYIHRWRVPLGGRAGWLRDRPLALRVKFMAAQRSLGGSLDTPVSYLALWQVGPPEAARVWRQEMQMAAETFNEFPIPANLIDTNGVLVVEFRNANPVTLLFPLEEGLEVLYIEGGFGANFVRGLGIIFCWLALLALIGLTSASFLSFPVAAFLALGILVVGLSSGTLSQIVEQGAVLDVNPNTGMSDNPSWLDRLLVPVFGGLLQVVNLVQGFSPIDSLSTGRMISWGQLFRAVGQIVLLLGGLFAAFGLTCFQRRELATAATTPS